MSIVSLTRRALPLGLAGLGLAGLGLAAHAAPGGRVFPLRFAYARITPSGFARISTDEQAIWSGMETRLGGLVNEMMALQPAALLGARQPELDGGASCVLIARAQAAEAGMPQVIVYATEEKERVYPSKDNWFSRSFATLRSKGMPHHPATAELHLLDVSGGDPVLSAFCDAPPRQPLNPFDNHRRPQREALVELTDIFERRLQALAGDGFRATQSRADSGLY